MPRKRIVIVEDERDMAELVAMRLRKEGYQVVIATDGVSGLSEIRSSAPDLILLDLMLPGMSGTEVLTSIRSDPRIANLPIIILSARSEESDVLVGLKLGADDYVTKPFSLSVLLARVDARLRRSAAGRPEGGYVKVGPISIDVLRHEVRVSGRPVSLTLTEFKLLAALAAAQGRVLTRNQVIDQAMGTDVVLTDRTVDVHIASLRRKLDGARDCVQTVRGIGYKMDYTSEHESPVEKTG